MKVETLTESHLRRLKVREYEIEDIGENLDDGLIQYYLSAQIKEALIDDAGEVIAIMGANVENGLCHSWMMASDLMYDHKVATLKMILRNHKEAVEKHGVKIFFTYNLPQYQREIEYLQSIGYVANEKTNDFDDKKERVLFIKRVD